MNCRCGLPLDEPLLMMVDGERLKSCPRCSVQVQRHCFHREASFGLRLSNGRPIVESCCPECRITATPRDTITTCRTVVETPGLE